MPVTKSRKRKHSELDVNDGSDHDDSPASLTDKRSHKRRKTVQKPQGKQTVTKMRKKKSTTVARESDQSGSESENASPVRSQTKSKPKSQSKKQSKSKKTKSPSKPAKARKTSKKEPESDAEEEEDENSSEYDPTQSSIGASKNMKRTRISVARPSSQRMSVSRSSSPRRRRAKDAADNNDEDDEDEDGDDEDGTQYRLVSHNERVLEMYEWLTSSTSWSDIKKTLDVWIDNESQCDDTENYAQLTLDVVNLILYCGGVRVFKLDDIEDLDFDTLDQTETKTLVRTLSNALQVHPGDVAGGAADGVAQKVLEKDALLWCNGTKTAQRSFESRYRQLLGHIGAALKQPIFDNDDWIVSIVFKWCKFLARSFRLSHVRRLGTFTAFCVCTPLVQAMSVQRKQMERLQDQLQRTELEQERKQNKNQKNQKKSPKTKKKKTEKLSSLEKNIDEFSTRIGNLQSHVTFVFMQIAVFKASDSHELIRCMVLQHLVKWINGDASVDSFLNQKHWQYLLYGLQDLQSAKVRVAALECCMDLFDFEQKFHGKLATSTSSKKTSPKRKSKRGQDDEALVVEREQDKLDETRKRILEPLWDRMSETVNGLLRDRDETVVKKCIEFVNILLRGDVLGPDDGDCILNYVFDENDDIRTMAAQFIYYDTFDNQAVLKTQTHSSNNAVDMVRIRHEAKLKDDVVELIQLVKDRVIFLNFKVSSLLNAERKRVAKLQTETENKDDEADEDEEEDDADDDEEERVPQATASAMRENALYRNYVQVSDYIVQSMGDRLGVMYEWNILCTMLIEADNAEQRRQERSVTQSTRASSSNHNEEAAAADIVEDMSAKQEIDEEGQTILCYLLLSCVKRATDCLHQHVRNVKTVRGRQRISSAKQEKQDALDSLKQRIVPHLARLLEIYQADVFKLYPLVQIIPLIPADAFNGVAQKDHLLRVCASLKTIFMRHETPFVRPQTDSQSGNDDADGDDDEAVFEEQDREAMEDRIRTRELKKLKRCVKREIDARLVHVVGAALTYFCTQAHEQKECCTRLLHDIVTHMSGDFERIADAIDAKLTNGSDFSSLPALLQLHDDDDEQQTSKLDLMQSLYTNLQRQYALRSKMEIGALQWTERMQSLMTSVLDAFLFAGAHYEVAAALQKLLALDIAHQIVHKLNHSSPDLERLARLRDQKQTLVHVLHFFVRETDQHKQTLSCAALLSCLDTIVSMMATMCFFRRMQGQSPLLDEVCNDARLSDWVSSSQQQQQPGHADHNHNHNHNHNQHAATDVGEQVKQCLLRVCRFVWRLPCIEDPFDPSAHTVTENVQIRFLMAAARLCLLEPTYYRSLGALILVCWHAHSVRYVLRAKPKDMRVDVRRKEITKKIAGQMHKHCHAALEEMLFEATKLIVDEAAEGDEHVKKKHVEELCRSVFMLEGLTRNRKVWMTFSKRFLSYILAQPQHVPSHFVYLHALTYLFSHLTNRDKLEIWSVFQSLSRKLPTQDIREQQDETQWQMYAGFSGKLKRHALQASEKRRLDYNEADIDNYDLTQSQAPPQQQQHLQQQQPPPDTHVQEEEEQQQPENGNADEDGGERGEEKVEDEDADADVDMNEEQQEQEEEEHVEEEQVVEEEEEEEEEEERDEVVEEEPPSSVTLQRISVCRPTKKRRRHAKTSDEDKAEDDEEESNGESDSEEEQVDETATRKKEKKRTKQKEGAKKGKWLKKKK